MRNLEKNPSPSMGEGQGWRCFTGGGAQHAFDADLGLALTTSALTSIPTLPPSRGKGFECTR
jgi:hypothetical protein